MEIKARIQNRYKSLEEWNATPSGEITPLKGEAYYAVKGDKVYQKIGDGVTDFTDLPWLLNQADNNESDETSPAYIKNRIIYDKVVYPTNEEEAILQPGANFTFANLADEGEEPTPVIDTEALFASLDPVEDADEIELYKKLFGDIKHLTLSFWEGNEDSFETALEDAMSDSTCYLCFDGGDKWSLDIKDWNWSQGASCSAIEAGDVEQSETVFFRTRFFGNSNLACFAGLMGADFNEGFETAWETEVAPFDTPLNPGAGYGMCVMWLREGNISECYIFLAADNDIHSANPDAVYADNGLFENFVLPVSIKWEKKIEAQQLPEQYLGDLRGSWFETDTTSKRYIAGKPGIKDQYKDGDYTGLTWSFSGRLENTNSFVYEALAGAKEVFEIKDPALITFPASVTDWECFANFNVSIGEKTYDHVPIKFFGLGSDKKGLPFLGKSNVYFGLYEMASTYFEDYTNNFNITAEDPESAQFPFAIKLPWVDDEHSITHPDMFLWGDNFIDGESITITITPCQEILTCRTLDPRLVASHSPVGVLDENKNSIMFNAASAASGVNSIAMGYNTTASGVNSIAMGYNTTASGENSIAMGYNTTASGDYSVAMGYNTNATSYGQLVIGRQNRPDSDQYFIVGNGNRNIFTISRSGDVASSGSISANHTIKSQFLDKVGQVAAIELQSPITPPNETADGETRVTITINNQIGSNSCYSKPLSNLFKFSPMFGGKTCTVALNRAMLFNGNLIPKNWSTTVSNSNGTTFETTDGINGHITIAPSTETQILNLGITSDWNYMRYSRYELFLREAVVSDFAFGVALDNSTYYTPSVGKTGFASVVSSYIYGELILIIPPIDESKEYDVKIPGFGYSHDGFLGSPANLPGTILKGSQDAVLSEAELPQYVACCFATPATLTVSSVQKTYITEERLAINNERLKQDLSTNLVLQSPNGAEWILKVADDGTLSAVLNDISEE